MVPRPVRTVLALACLVPITASVAWAEVAVRTDRTGQYVATEMVTTGMGGEAVVWGLRGRMARRVSILNPKGDLNGDLWPVVVESSVAPNYPWVVWSRFNGTDFDLAWSRWTSGGWKPVEPILSEPAPGDDVDPDLAFDGEGRAYLAWGRESAGTSEVQLSVWVGHRWLNPTPISQPGVDSRHPVILGLANGALSVEFSTPDGLVVQRVLFSAPDTITDDINPVPYIRVIGTPSYNGAQGPDWETE